MSRVWLGSTLIGSGCLDLDAIRRIILAKTPRMGMVHLLADLDSAAFVTARFFDALSLSL